MNKNNIIIFSLLLLLTIGIVTFNYSNQLVALFVEGAAPNPGHSLTEIEGGADLATKTYVDNAVSGIIGSNWTVSGSNIYRSSGNVGIGTASPTAKLHVVGNIIASNPIASNHVATKEYVDAASGPACPTNYANLCTNGGGLSFTYGGHTMYIDAFPRSSAWYTSGSPTGQGLAWQMCQDIGARLPTLAEWQAACTALGGPNGNGTTTFGGLNIATRYEWVANPSSANVDQAVLAGGGTCSGTSAYIVYDNGYGYWFRCIR